MILRRSKVDSSFDLNSENDIAKDILERADIELLVNTFYDKVKVDEKIGPFFNNVAKIDWNKLR